VVAMLVSKRAFPPVVRWTLAVLAVLAGCDPSSGNEGPRAHGPTVSRASRHDASPPLWLLRHPHGNPAPREKKDHPEEPQPMIPFSRTVAPDSVRQSLYAAGQPTAPLSSFDG